MFDITTFDVVKYDNLLASGLSNGLGVAEPGMMCIEAAICNILGLEHGDDPKCVASAVRQFKIKLNDCNWSSNITRAEGLRDLGLAQLGSLNIVSDLQFITTLSKKIIQVLIPDLFRRIFPNNKKCLDASNQCELLGTANAAKYAANAANSEYAANSAYAAYAANAANAAKYAADSANAANAVNAAKYAADAANSEYAADSANAAKNAAKYAANAANSEYAANSAYAAYAADSANAANDYYLNLAAKLALDTLKELNSPGCQLLS